MEIVLKMKKVYFRTVFEMGALHTDEQTKKYLLGLSPGAWVHINMLGYYQFCGGDRNKHIERMIMQWDWQKHVNLC